MFNIHSIPVARYRAISFDLKQLIHGHAMCKRIFCSVDSPKQAKTSAGVAIPITITNQTHVGVGVRVRVRVDHESERASTNVKTLESIFAADAVLVSRIHLHL